MALTKVERTNAFAQIIASVVDFLPTYHKYMEEITQNEDESLIDEIRSVTPLVDTSAFTDGAFRDAVLGWSVKQEGTDLPVALGLIITKSVDARVVSDDPDGGEACALAVTAGIAFSNNAFDVALEQAIGSKAIAAKFDQEPADLSELITKAISTTILDGGLTKTAEFSEGFRTMCVNVFDSDEFWSEKFE